MSAYTKFTWTTLAKVSKGLALSYVEKQHLKKYFADWSESDVPKLLDMKERGTLPEIGNTILAIYAQA